MRRLFQTLTEAVDALGPFDTPAEEADAHRHLLRLVSASLDLHVERADPARPLPTVWMSPTRKFLGDSPDTCYTTIPVSAAHTYRLEIDPGDALYVGALVYGREHPGAPVRIVSSVIDADLTTTGDVYVVEVGAHVGLGDRSALRLDDESFWVMVRHYFAEPEAVESGSVVVQRTDGHTPDGPIDATAFGQGVAAATDWIAAQIRADVALDDLMLLPDGAAPPPAEPRQFPPGLVSQFYPAEGIAYQGRRAILDPGDEVRVTFTPPPCRFWSVSLMTPWLESVEHRVVPASVTSASAEPAGDGSVTVVVSEHDPEQPNWIPARGYRRLQIAYRVLVPEEPPADARFEQVPATR